MLQESAASDATTPRRRKTLSLLLALGLAAVLLYFSLRGIDWSKVFELLSSARLPMVGLLVLTNMAALLLRAIRWRVLLQSRQPVTLRAAFFATSAGYLANNVLPARAGEILRSVMISRQAGLSRTFVLTTAFLERVADAIALVTISGVVLAFWTSVPDWLSRAAVPFAIGGVISLIVMAVLPRVDGLLFRILGRIPKPASLHDRAQHMLEQVLHGVGSFHDAGRLVRFVALTMVIWFIDAVTTVVAASAIGLTIGLPLAFLLIAGLGLGSALPSTPGYVGIFQFVAIGILTPAGLTRSEAIAYILFWQAINYVVVCFWGVIALAFEKRSPAAATPVVCPEKSVSLSR